jgi:predicted DNA-binding WGR domain protein
VTDTISNLQQAMSKYSGAVPENDLVHMFVPLMRQIAVLHAQDKVARVHPKNIIENTDGSLSLANPEGYSINANHAGLMSIQPLSDSALHIVGDISVTTDAEIGRSIEDLQVLSEEFAIGLEKPQYLLDYQSWEDRISHHDQLTDVFCLGLIFAACACHLDLDDKSDLQLFSLNRANLYRLNSRIHPAIATLIEGMTHLNRHDRDSDMQALALRLDNYREQQGRFNPEQLLDRVKALPERRAAILGNLRDRLFDLSKRNRLIHFKATQASVNLTVASVPLVMRLESIRKDQLCTWGNHFEKSILSAEVQPLGQWLRFEDQSYLPSALDRLISQSRRDKAEYGFSSLRLVIGFLNWYNLKDDASEKITSPLLWLNVDVKKKKGVRDRYLIQNHEPVAEFNPALRHYLKQLYDIDLPEEVDLSEVSVAQVHQQLAQQIAKTEPDVNLRLTAQPSVRLIHQKAVKRLRKFEKRRGKRIKRQSALAKYNYDKNDYTPLGRAIFENHIVLEALPQRSALGVATESRPSFMTGKSATAEAQTYTLDKNDTSKYGWEIDLAEVTLTNFNYKKMSLVRDYSSLIEDAKTLDSLDRLFSIKPREEQQSAPAALPVEQQWNVVPSDITQDQAVALARQGSSFIIQGPPGTGKSQTITNLIADFAARGKRVLFVCEKRAALDVVFNRLKLAGLDKLACIIHDIQEDKKPFIHDLKAVYEEWFESESQSERSRSMRVRTIEAFFNNFSQIERLESALGTLSNAETENIRSLIRRQLALPTLGNEYSEVIREQLPMPATWDAEQRLAKRIQLSMTERFDLVCLADSVYANLNAESVEGEQAYKTISEFAEQAEQLSDRLSDLVDGLSEVLGESYSLPDLQGLAEIANQAVQFKLHNFLDLFDSHSSLSEKLALDLNRLQQQEQQLAEKVSQAKHWKVPFSQEDSVTALALAREKESGFFSFFSGPWRALKKTVEKQYDFSAHAVKPSVVSVIEKLIEMFAAEQAHAAIRAEIAGYLKTDEAESLLALRDELHVKQHSDSRLKALLASPDCRNGLLGLSQGLADVLQLKELLVQHLDEQHQLWRFDFLQENIRDMRESLDDLPEILPLLKATYQIDHRVGFVLRRIQGNVSAMEALVIDQALQVALREHPELASFDTAKLADHASRTAKAKDILLSQNAKQIIANRHHHFGQNVRHSTLSASQLDPKALAFKKRYSTGRREVEHEFGKTMRYRSIRDMASDETGTVVSDLKPIWLMSPLSVSDTLPMEPDLFDVVIFDEASQIPVEDGIPALCRAPQLIVVGDEMQLPPTSFFSTAVVDDDLEIEVQEDGEVLSVLLDADSLLSQAARHLPATLLAWHYRSRSESLISFSNAAFYDGKLVTIPDQQLAANQFAQSEPSPDDTLAEPMDRSGEIEQTAEQPSMDEVLTAEKAEREPESSDLEPVESQSIIADLATLSVAKLLANPISFHLSENGVYERRSNLYEAEVIAAMVRELLIERNGQTIGIVAFSEAQQNCVEEALDRLAEDDTEFSGLLEEEYTREDNEQFNGLFVKNLENVQGDERDIIILSICFAPGPNGKMLMNFGPINQRGGEKRLNVIFSRARNHMAVVSSIRANAITNTHNDGAFALRAFLAFAEAQDQGNADAGRIALASVNPNVLNIFSAKPPEDPLREAIALALTARGHEVREFVGSARFRCDIAIVDPQTGDYALGILLDHNIDETPSHTFERFVFKPSILRSFGWKIIDIPSYSWHQSADKVLAHIDYLLSKQSAEIPLSEEDLYENIALPAFTAPGQFKPSEDKLLPDNQQTIDEQEDDFKHFHFQQGKSDKFWRIVQRDLDVIVHYGRSGTKGQKVTKSYDSETRATREMNKLILEKTRKGYQEL